MQSKLHIVIVAFLSILIVSATSLCIIEGSVHPLKVTPHDNPNHYDHHHNEKTSKNSSHSHENENDDACCKNLLAYLVSMQNTPDFLHRASAITFLIPDLENDIIGIIYIPKSFIVFKQKHSSPQWEKYVLSNPPHAPPLS